MTRDEFARMMDNLFEKCKGTMVRKEDEYESSIDTFNSFERMANFTEMDTKEIILIQGLKHIESLLTMIQRDEKNRELWEEKSVDAINYITLLYAYATRNLHSGRDSKGGGHRR